MLVLTADQIRTVEQNCFESYYNEAQLMQRAGSACFDAIVEEYGEKLKESKVSVLCGNGKNAGDGFVIARLLYDYGANAKIVLCDKEPTIQEPLRYFCEAVSSGVAVERFDGDVDGDYIVDCIFGIGFSGEPRSPFDKVFEAVAKKDATVISIDTPSGTNATTGEACKNAVSADFTVAISCLKMCHILPPSNGLCGKIVTVDIGIPRDCYENDYVKTIELLNVQNSFPSLDFNANKGTNGKLLNISGSYKMPGAAVISTMAALRSGVGLVNLAIPKHTYRLVSAHLVQNVFTPVDDRHGTLRKGSFEDLENLLDKYNAILFGCGIGNTKDTENFTNLLLQNLKCPTIIDADGINNLLSCINILKDVKVPVVLTPHPGEMARLTSKTIDEVQRDRIGVAKDFAKNNNVIVVLKGANTVVTDGDSVFVNTTGNCGMAMAGTGDMLAGMIGAFVAMGLKPLDAAKAGAFIHGLAGDSAAKLISLRGFTVLDMIDQLGALMSQF